MLRRRPLLAAGIALAALVVGLGTPSADQRPEPRTTRGHCDRAASPSGDDGGPGTIARPFRSVERLADALGAGQVGCLLAGVFEEDVRVGGGGAPGRPITLKGAPGRRATLVGSLDIAADDVVIAGLRLFGRGRASPQVNGDRVTFSGNEITNGHRGICLLLGAGFESGYARARSVVITRNRIHHCGRLPATGHDHGIYVEGTNDVRITHNVIHDNADYGIHLYPDAQRTHIAGNIIEGNGGGVIFAGEESGGEYESDYASSGNVVRNNVISNSRQRHNIESWWGGPTGTGNVAARNCLWNGAKGNLSEQEGFRAAGNVVASPAFRGRRRGDLRLRAGTLCARILASR